MLKFSQLFLICFTSIVLGSCKNDKLNKQNHLKTLSETLEVLRKNNLKNIDEIQVAIENNGRRAKDVEQFKLIKNNLNKSTLDGINNKSLINYLQSLDSLYKIEKLSITQWDILFQRTMYYMQSEESEENYLLGMNNLLLLEKALIAEIATKISSCCHFYRNFNAYANKEIYNIEDTVNILWVIADCFDTSHRELKVNYSDIKIIGVKTEKPLKIISSKKIAGSISLQFIVSEVGDYHVTLKALLQSVYTTDEIEEKLEKIIKVE